MYHSIVEPFRQVPARVVFSPEQISVAERPVGAAGTGFTVNTKSVDDGLVQPFTTQVAV